MNLKFHKISKIHKNHPESIKKLWKIQARKSKAKNMKNEINGFDCLVLGLVNIGNRIGIAIQSNII